MLFVNLGFIICILILYHERLKSKQNKGKRSMTVEELTQVLHALICVYGIKQAAKLFKKLTKNTKLKTN